MSASLVGSEMCIRDSAHARPRARVRVQAQTACACPRARSRTYAHVPAGAVSYTHLTLPTICSV
eukprot:956275-Alexandrium_andersonii.AAC.1